ncbi:MAG: molybdopterin-dependent oxidoreductase [Chloroflexi bacterium]|nr:molybdopterin-dependent oxidoreductase [Chloroflexota bacterium]MCI0577239.1 molybdopterin-dependent oxidoreductase [Chloroflexota bacterium]MCI0646720.1 molybdopterin-dependent oxidoreductase [Chloroflexota bacterium]MCI0731354.1 molybdopterin-dependent oxidoreductase [Chloroflexota bacterium]
MTPRVVHGACPHDCPDTCGIVTVVEDGRAVDFYGDPDHPITQGWLCAKVRPYLEHVYHPERLTHPLRRVGPKGSGRWQRTSWEEAIGEIAGRWQDVIARYGAEAILPYSYSGTLGLVQMGVASGRFWNRLGASQLERSICGAAAEQAVEATLGARRSPPYDELRQSRLIILWGHNPVSTAPHLMPFLRQAQRNGTQVVVIDPRRTRTARGADWHLAPIPGTDGALAMGLAHLIVREGLHDEAWLAEHTTGWPQLRERLAAFPPERTAALTGLAVEDIVALAHLYATAKPGLIKIADGINRNRNGGQNVRAVCALPAVTGQYGVPGGGLAYSTSGYIRWDSEAVNKWSQCPPPGRVVNMVRLGAALLGEVTDPPIKSLFVFGANPATSAPNAGRIVEGLRREDLFTVVHDLFMTDTASYADLVLPATSQLEQADLHKAYGHTLLAYNHPAIPPLGESKSNWEVMRLLARAMGLAEPWLHQEVDEVIEEVLAATGAYNPALQGITLERLKREKAIPLALETTTPFAGGRFPTPSGKVELYSEALAAEGLDPLPGHFDESLDPAASPTQLGRSGQADGAAGALRLVSGAAHHFVSSSLANQAGLLKHEGTPFVEIHPADAAARGINHGDAVILENGRGWVELRAVVTDGIRPGVVASPKGRWARLDGGRNINWVTSDDLADMAGQSTYHSTQVWLRRAE